MPVIYVSHLIMLCKYHHLITARGCGLQDYYRTGSTDVSGFSTSVFTDPVSCIIIPVAHVYRVWRLPWSTLFSWWKLAVLLVCSTLVSSVTCWSSQLPLSTCVEMSCTAGVWAFRSVPCTCTFHYLCIHVHVGVQCTCTCTYTASYGVLLWTCWHE